MKTISSKAVQLSDAAIGWSSGHAPMAGAAGLPNTCLTAAATAPTGFQSATARSATLKHVILADGRDHYGVAMADPEGREFDIN